MASVFKPPIAVKSSSIHHKGVFARRDIKKGEKIIEYVGERITKAESERRADVYLDAAKKSKRHGAVYIFTLSKRYDIDGNVGHNPAKYINHSCDPNAEAWTVRGHIWIEAMRDIEKGEEITYNYGYDMANYKDHPCRCGAKKCVGYILDTRHWWRLKKIKASQ